VYDSGGKLIAYVDPAGNRTSYAYDSANRVRSITSPLAEVTTYNYVNTLTLAVTDARSHVTTVSFDGDSKRSRRSDDGRLYAMDGRERSADAFEGVASVAPAPELAGGRAEPDRGSAAVVEIQRVAQHREPGVLFG